MIHDSAINRLTTIAKIKSESEQWSNHKRSLLVRTDNYDAEFKREEEHAEKLEEYKDLLDSYLE